MINITLDDLPAVCKRIVDLLPDGGIVVLQGDLASGKTTLTQSFASFLGLNDVVTSPTFSLQQIYGDKLFHYDLYNYGLEKFLSLGMLEELERSGYHLVEWGDDTLIDWLKRCGLNTVIVKIEKSAENTRNYEVEYA